MIFRKRTKERKEGRRGRKEEGREGREGEMGGKRERGREAGRGKAFSFSNCFLFIPSQEIQGSLAPSKSSGPLYSKVKNIKNIGGLQCRHMYTLYV